MSSLLELREATQEALDWRAPLRRHPLQAVATAAALGVGLGILSRMSTGDVGGGRPKTRRKDMVGVVGLASLLLPAIGRPLAALVEHRLRRVVGLSASRSRR